MSGFSFIIHFVYKVLFENGILDITDHYHSFNLVEIIFNILLPENVGQIKKQMNQQQTVRGSNSVYV